jgi:hypothetical protein
MGLLANIQTPTTPAKPKPIAVQSPIQIDLSKIAIETTKAVQKTGIPQIINEGIVVPTAAIIKDPLKYPIAFGTITDYIVKEPFQPKVKEQVQATPAIPKERWEPGQNKPTGFVGDINDFLFPTQIKSESGTPFLKEQMNKDPTIRWYGQTMQKLTQAADITTSMDKIRLAQKADIISRNQEQNVVPELTKRTNKIDTYAQFLVDQKKLVGGTGQKWETYKWSDTATDEDTSKLDQMIADQTKVWDVYQTNERNRLSYQNEFNKAAGQHAGSLYSVGLIKPAAASLEWQEGAKQWVYKKSDELAAALPERYGIRKYGSIPIGVAAGAATTLPYMISYVYQVSSMVPGIVPATESVIRKPAFLGYYGIKAVGDVAGGLKAQGEGVVAGEPKAIGSAATLILGPRAIKFITKASPIKVSTSKYLTGSEDIITELPYGKPGEISGNILKKIQS